MSMKNIDEILSTLATPATKQKYSSHSSGKNEVQNNYYMFFPTTLSDIIAAGGHADYSVF